MNGTDGRTPLEILLVEDDPGDVAMTREALGESKLHVNLRVVTDGEEAVSYLRRASPLRARPATGFRTSRPQPPA